MLYPYILPLQSSTSTTYHSQPLSPPTYPFTDTYYTRAFINAIEDTELDMSDVTSLESPQLSQPTDSPIPLFSSPRPSTDINDNVSIYQAKVKQQRSWIWA